MDCNPQIFNIFFVQLRLFETSAPRPFITEGMALIWAIVRVAWVYIFFQCPQVLLRAAVARHSSKLKYLKREFERTAPDQRMTGHPVLAHVMPPNHNIKPKHSFKS